MKFVFMAAAFVTALGVVQSVSPARAQTADEIKRICVNKHGLGKYWVSASEAQRKAFATRYAACVRSKGKN